MKKQLCLFCAVLTIISILSNSFNVTAYCTEDPYSKLAEDPYFKSTENILDSITKQLRTMPGSGSVSFDFLSEEILLHKAILLTSINISSYTTNPELISFTSDIIDQYSGELQELKIELDKLSEDFKVNGTPSDDSEYMKEYKTIINTLTKQLSSNKNASTDEAIYINQTLALLEASNTLAKNTDKYAEKNVVKKTSEAIVKNTESFISELKPLQSVFK